MSMAFADQLSEWRRPVKDSTGRVVAHERGLKETANKLGVNYNSLLNWVYRGSTPHPKLLETLLRKMKPQTKNGKCKPQSIEPQPK